MNELIEYLELELGKKVDRDKLAAHVAKHNIDVTTVWYIFQTTNKVAKEQLLMIYNNLNIWGDEV